MGLYELHAYRTQHYDRKSEKTVRLKDDNFGLPRVWEWIEKFLAEFPDGKVVVSEVGPMRRFRQRWPGKEKVTKIMTATNTGTEYHGRLAVCPAR